MKRSRLPSGLRPILKRYTMNTVNVRTLSEMEAYIRLGFRIIGHAWDSLGGFLIMREV
jgi:hypothetical protein